MYIICFKRFYSFHFIYLIIISPGLIFMFWKTQGKIRLYTKGFPRTFNFPVQTSRSIFLRKKKPTTNKGGHEQPSFSESVHKKHEQGNNTFFFSSLLFKPQRHQFFPCPQMKYWLGFIPYVVSLEIKGIRSTILIRTVSVQLLIHLHLIP